MSPARHNYQYKPSTTNHGDHQEINRLDNWLSSTNRHDCHASWRNRKTVPVTATTWTNGVSLGTDIPVGKSATVQFTTKATGTAGQVLRAGITTSGNYSGVSTSATVRVKDNDQAIVTPTAEGFISVPTFNFGQVGVAGSTQQHSLKSR